MPAFESRIDTNSDDFKKNREQMLALVAEFRGLEQKVRDRSNSQKDRFRKRGQLLPRERIALLLDKDSPWLELGTLAGLGMHDDDGKDDVLGAASIVGIGYVCGIRVMVGASDSAIKGGTTAPMGLKKNLRAQQVALENNLPCIYLVDSGGAFLPMQSEVFPDSDDFGRIFRNNAVISASGLGQIAAIMGNCVAGGGYLPVLCDKLLMTEGSGLYLAGPALVKSTKRCRLSLPAFTWSSMIGTSV